MSDKTKRFFHVLGYVVALGFVVRQAQEQNIALAFFVGALLFDFRRLKRFGKNLIVQDGRGGV